MPTNSGEWHYAGTVNEQYNPNLHKEVSHWRYLSSAVGSDNRMNADVYYSKASNGDVILPCDLTAHDFGLDIPINAHINSVTVQMGLTSLAPHLEVKAPWLIFNVYGSDIPVQDGEWRKTGWIWNGGSYAVASDEILSTSEKVITYTFPENEWNTKKYPSKSLNDSIMGVDILFEEPNRFDGTNAQIRLNWIRIKVDYEMPRTTLQFGSLMWDELNPYEQNINTTFRVPMDYKNLSKASAGHDQVVYIDLPKGITLERYEITDQYSNLEVIDDFKGQYKWNVDGGIGAKNHLDLWVHADTFGEKIFTATNQGRTVYGYAYINSKIHNSEYSEAHISSSDVIKGKETYFHFRTKVISNDTSIKYKVTVDGENQSDPSDVSQTFRNHYKNPTGEGNYLVKWGLSNDSIANGVRIVKNRTDNDYIEFQIPDDEVVEIYWIGCFIPVTEGENTLYLVEYDNGNSYTYEYTSHASDGVKAKFTMGDTIWSDHRVLCEFQTGGYVIPFASKDTDKHLLEGNCALQMHIQEPHDYIGCVPITHGHFDPKSTYTNKGIKKTYKNKVYMGKTGEIDENITFHIRFPPKDWATLQGLCELDKPVPVNANHKLFEGDVLNHRGWVELNGVKNVEKTNPHWYKGELDVDYITHNINTRFQISKGVPVSNYGIDTLKDLLDYVVESGDEFADYTYTNTDGDIVHNNTGYFNIDSDGNYIYDDTQALNRRTLITMDNGQSIWMKSVDPIGESSNISMEWYSTKIAEDRENKIDRTIKLVDKDGQAVLEYKYYDYDFNSKSDRYTCRVNCTVLDKSINSYRTVIDRDMALGNDVESLNLTKDVNGHVVQETEPSDYDMMDGTSRTYFDPSTSAEVDSDPFSYNDFMYGSKIHFKIHGNVLSIVDEGFTGKEISRDSIQLEKGEYYFVVEFKNNNTDGDTNDVLHFFDFEIQETILSSQYKQLYSDVVVSSFPIPNKTLLYTRRSEEGLLYYYKNDEGAFTYIQEPFYMYWNGVDLRSKGDISLFNLNNSYALFYLQNGLVRLGFNRLNGQLYLYKYDVQSDSYVFVTQMQLKEYTDFNIGAFSDDKIEVKVGKTVFTMYRGYPYVLVQHNQDDIDLTTVFNRVYAEGVNGVNTDFPVYWDLINSDNLLPHCITDDDIKSSCIKGSTVYNEDVGTEPVLSLTKTSPSVVKNGDTVIFTVEGAVSNVDEEIDINHPYVGVFGSYTTEVVIDDTAPYLLTLNGDKNPMQTDNHSKLTAQLLDYGYRGLGNVRVNFYERYIPTFLNVSPSKGILQTGDDIEITAKLQDEDGSLLRDLRVDFYEEHDTIFLLSSSTDIVQTNGTTEITCALHDSDGSPVIGEEVHFYEEYTPTTIGINATKSITQTSDTVEIKAVLKDDDGSLIKGEKVNFYEVYDPTYLRGFTSKHIAQTSDTVEVYARLSDDDGSAIPNHRVDFYEEYVPTRITMSANPPVIQTSDTTDVMARLQDRDGSIIRSEPIHFGEPVDNTDWNIFLESSGDLIQTDNTIDMSVTITDDDGEPVEDIYVGFYVIEE